MKDTAINEYYSAVNAALNAHPEWRYGQTLFNVLHSLYPELSEQIRGADIDPFYKSDCDEFKDWIEAKLR